MSLLNPGDSSVHLSFRRVLATASEVDPNTVSALSEAPQSEQLSAPVNSNSGHDMLAHVNGTTVRTAQVNSGSTHSPIASNLDPPVHTSSPKSTSGKPIDKELSFDLSDSDLTSAEKLELQSFLHSQHSVFSNNWSQLGKTHQHTYMNTK